MPRFLAIIAIALGFSFVAPARNHGFDFARSLVDRVQVDLNHAANMPQGHKDSERYARAQHRLSEFDRQLSKGKFDKDKLDAAIEEVKDVVNHTTLTPDDRDVLSRDLQDLRVLREKRGAM